MKTSPPPESRQRVAASVAILLVVAAALLVAGVVLERSAEASSQHSIVTTAEHQEGDGHDESAEEGRSEGLTPATDKGGEAAEQRTELGIESPWIVALGSLAAVALAVAVWRRPSRPIIAAVAAFTAVATLLDALEVAHQAAEGRPGLTLLAALIVAIRVATIAGCVYLYRPTSVTT